MLNAIRKNGVVLAIFAANSTWGCRPHHYLTKDQINKQEQAQLLSVLNQVILKTCMITACINPVP